jgi:hypothetical protein
LEAGAEQGEDDKPVQGEEQERSSWVLCEREVEGYVDLGEYKRRRYAEVARELEQVEPGAYEEYKRQAAARIAHEARGMVQEVVPGMGSWRTFLREVMSLSRRLLGLVGARWF